MKYLTKYLGLIMLLLTFYACSKENQELGYLNMVDEEAGLLATEQEFSETVERKLIKDGRVEFETDQLNTTRKTIFEAVKKHKGYVSSDQEYKSPGRKSNTITIRVPADNFDNLLNDAIQGVKRFDNKEINVKDVTEEFLDIQARLKTKKELEQRYAELIKQANNVTEILEIEKETGALRSDIESIEGRLNYLQNRISLSTLTITFYENVPNETLFGQEFSNGFKNGWNNLIWFFIMLINIWPFIVIGIGLIIGIRIYRRKK